MNEERWKERQEEIVQDLKYIITFDFVELWCLSFSFVIMKMKDTRNGYTRRDNSENYEFPLFSFFLSYCPYRTLVSRLVRPSLAPLSTHGGQSHFPTAAIHKRITQKYKIAIYVDWKQVQADMK